MKEQGARNDFNDNVIEVAKQGNSRSYTLSRLQRESPELWEKVKAIIPTTRRSFILAHIVNM